MNALFVFCIILCCCLLEVVVGFQFNTLQSRSSRLSTIRQLQASKKSPAAVGRCDALHMSMDPNELDDDVRAKIDKLVKNNKVVLFMKGNKLFPQCGFSNTACRILQAVNTQFEAVNILEDERIRNGIKIYSSWPTIPQLYVGGEFVGGSDIMVELYNNGQLAEMIEVANAN